MLPGEPVQETVEKAVRDAGVRNRGGPSGQDLRGDRTHLLDSAASGEVRGFERVQQRLSAERRIDRHQRAGGGQQLSRRVSQLPGRQAELPRQPDSQARLQRGDGTCR